ncbi:hypothetical protein GA0061070_11023 [Kosakonia oryziphila]|uniref:Peptidase S24/S26A/S26B/S26C domain-containing protein n=1 Tax=Kosakonia oryziphila TaxID=1005667 RepID=A0A1C4GP26_9ENTR|nr:hypothetical protein GA0061070_11023 [Kosakonia oryziphila]
MYVDTTGSHASGLRIFMNGDLLVVDSAMKPVNGDIVAAGMGAEFTVMRLIIHPRLCLQPMDPAFPPRCRRFRSRDLASLSPSPDHIQMARWIAHSLQAIPGPRSVESTPIYTRVSVRALQAAHAMTHPAEREVQIRDDNTKDEHHNDNTNDTT